MRTLIFLLLSLFSLNITAQIYYIPTVVHVLHFDEDEDMTLEEVEALINHTNIGLRGLSNYDAVSRMIFDTLWADTEIQICLASVDELGNPTDGIIHQPIDTPIEVGDWFRMKGESDPWDTDLYLNIWICSMGPNSDTYGGVATTPTIPHSTFPNPHIGVMLNNDCYNPFQLLIHEVGHFLGLRHLYFDDIDDTPCSNNAIDPEQSCESSFLTINTCSNEAPFWNGVDPPDMIENYMEYYGNCAKMFTKGQKAWMHDYINTHYQEMIEADLVSCDLVLDTEVADEKIEEVSIYPNPTDGKITIEYGRAMTYQLINIQGQILANGKGQDKLTIDLENYPKGLFFLKIEDREGSSTHKILKQ